MPSFLGSNDLTTPVPQDATSVTAIADSPNVQNYHVPVEITSNIISCVVGGGLQLSSGPSHDIHLKTILSLMHTNKATREETLRLLLCRPLHFYVTSEETCNCNLEMMEITQEFCRAAFHNKVCATQALLQLVPGTWPEIVVHLAPEAATCNGFLAATKIVAHSSKVLDNLIGETGDLALASSELCAPGVPPNFKLVFESPSEDFPTSETGECLPPWNISIVNRFMSQWWSFLKRYKGAVKVELPKKISTVFKMTAHPADRSLLQYYAEWVKQVRSEIWNLGLWETPTSIQLSTFALLWSEKANYEWYLNPLPLVRLPTDELVNEPYVLVITAPYNHSNKDTSGSGGGELFAFQGTRVPPSSPERS